MKTDVCVCSSVYVRKTEEYLRRKPARLMPKKLQMDSPGSWYSWAPW